MRDSFGIRLVRNIRNARARSQPVVLPKLFLWLVLAGGPIMLLLPRVAPVLEPVGRRPER
jgi:hypothetical protein